MCEWQAKRGYRLGSTHANTQNRDRFLNQKLTGLSQHLFRRKSLKHECTRDAEMTRKQKNHRVIHKRRSHLSEKVCLVKEDDCGRGGGDVYISTGSSKGSCTNHVDNERGWRGGSPKSPQLSYKAL